MKLGIGVLGFGPKATINIEKLKHAERLGFHSAWTAEAYGNDAATTAAWALANTTTMKVGTSIMQMPARTPAMTAMTAMTLDHLSEGRFILGLGPSGPQVIEGWHGVPYGRPLTKTREYIQIIRDILRREKPLEFQGREYSIPCSGEGTTNLGKPLKSILHGNPDLPIFTASISPAGLKCAAEVADGVFPLWMDPDQYETVLGPALEEGFTKADGNKSLANFEVLPGVSVHIDDDEDAARAPVKSALALYIGGMGARNKNFYNDYVKRMGYEEAAIRIQDLFLDGKRDEAREAVPDKLVDAMHLCGPADKIRDHLKRWKEAGKKGHVTSMNIRTEQPEALELLAEEML